MKKIVLGVCVIAIFSLFALPIFAQSDAPAAASSVEMKATVTKMQGEVMVTKAGQSTAQPLKIGDMLGSGDKIETKDNGKAEIKIANGNTLNMTPNSNLTLSKLTSDPATGEYDNLLESKAGTIRAHVAAKIKGKSSFKIKTPTAMCGARGTVFYIVVTATGTQVFVTDGSVDFSSPSTGDTFVVVEDMAALSSATGVSEPVELTGADKDAVLAAYEASLSDGSDTPLDQDIPDGPSQDNSPQTPTYNPSPTPTPPSPSDTVGAN